MSMSLRSLAMICAVLLPAQAAYANEIEDQLQAAFDSGELAGLHGVLVRRDGQTLAEAYFEGQDQRWGDPLGERQFGPEELHDLRSISKSIVSLLYGIALDRDLVPPPEAGLLAQFPEYADLAEPQRNAITIEHVLTMQMGLEWNEQLPYTNPKNSEVAMELAEDKLRFILSRPIVDTPGTTWSYSGGSTALLGALISRGSGQTLAEFAQEALFQPLGINKSDWVLGLDGKTHAAASGLRLTAPDLARIGTLLANKGQYQGQQIVSQSWITRSFTAHAAAGGLRYGYQWWLAPVGTPPVWAAGFGNGGQRLTVGQKTGTVVVIQAGNYNQPDDWKLPVKIMEEFLIPGLPPK